MSWRTRLAMPPDDRAIVLLLAVLALALAARVWLAENPGANPWAPLDLRDEPGWTTGPKIAALRGDAPACQMVLQRSAVEFAALAPAGEGECLRDDRLVLATAPLSPADPAMTCVVAAGLSAWLLHDVEALAREVLSSQLARIEHLGTANCRRINGASQGRWSEHATGNAIDIAAFVLADGRRVSVAGDWQGDGAEARFLHAVRDAACASFGTVLSPDYNAAHADHLHFDQGRGVGRGTCR